MRVPTSPRFLTALALAAVFAASAAQAGRSCEQKPPTPQSIAQGMALAQRASEALDAEHARSGARVALLGRAGRDLSEYHLRYSHVGGAYKTPEGPWRVLHKLNACGANTASLYRQGLGDFSLTTSGAMRRCGRCPRPRCKRRFTRS